MGFGKTVSKSKTVPADITLSIYWEKADAEPTSPPTGYEDYARASDLDLDFGLLGKYYAWTKLA